MMGMIILNEVLQNGAAGCIIALDKKDSIVDISIRSIKK